MPEPTEFAALLTAALDDVPDGGDSALLWKALGQRGVLDRLYADGATPPPALLKILLTELDGRFPLGVTLTACVQVATALPLLHEAGGSDLVADVRARALRGEVLLALGATDAQGAGSDLMSLGTTAELGDDGVVVHGGKRWITNARTARYALVLARHRPQRHFTSFVWVVVPLSAPGVHSETAGTTLLRGSGVGHLRFDRVSLSRDHVLGRPGRGLASFVRTVTTERLASAFWAAALCRRVLATTHRGLAVRPLGEGTAWDNAVVRQQFARCLIELRRIETMTDQHVDTGSDDPVSGMILKAALAESLDTVLTQCAQLIGADAFADDGIAQLRAEAAMFGIAGGAHGAMLAGIADHAADLLGTRAP